MEKFLEAMVSNACHSLSSCYEIKATVVREVPLGKEPIQFRRAEDVASFFRAVIPSSSWFDPDKEAVIVLALNVRNRLIGFNLVSLGSVSCSLVNPREVFRPAIALAASSIVLMHNHPSGDPCPSPADSKATRVLKAAGRIVEIELADHVIVGRREVDPLKVGWYSFREAGFL